MSAESDNNRTKLLRAAAELFANKGFVAVSTRDLCNHASVNVAAISYYFGGKEGLYLEVFEANARRVSEKMSAVLKNHEGKVNSKESLAAALTDFIGVIVDLRIQEPEVSIVLQKQSIGNIPGVHEAVVKIMGPLGDEVTHFFKQSQDQKFIRADLNVRSFLTILVESAWGYSSLQERGLGILKDAYELPRDRDQFVEFLAQIYIRGICS